MSKGLLCFLSLTSDGCIYLEQIRFVTKNLRRRSYNVQCLIISQSTLSIKVILQESNIGLAWILPRPELLLCRLTESRCLYVLDNPFLCGDLSTVIGCVNGEINLWYFRLSRHLFQCIFKPLLLCTGARHGRRKAVCSGESEKGGADLVSLISNQGGERE